jgi:hypothetical protein
MYEQFNAPTEGGKINKSKGKRVYQYISCCLRKRYSDSLWCGLERNIFVPNLVGLHTNTVESKNEGNPEIHVAQQLHWCSTWSVYTNIVFVS